MEGRAVFTIVVSSACMKKPSWIAGLVKRYGYDLFLLVNTVLVGASIVGFAAFSPSFPLIGEIAILTLFGACNSMQFAAINSVTLKGLSIKDAGSGNSLFSMVQMLAIGLSVSIGGSLVQVFEGCFGSVALGFKLSFVCMGVVTLLSAVVFRRLLDTACPRARRAAPAPATR